MKSSPSVKGRQFKSCIRCSELRSAMCRAVKIYRVGVLHKNRIYPTKYPMLDFKKL